MKIKFEQPERYCLNTASWGADGNQSQKSRRVGGNYTPMLKISVVTAYSDFPHSFFFNTFKNMI